MSLCDAGRALTLGSIPLAGALGHLTMAQVYLVSLVEGTLFVFFSLAESAALPCVVAKEQLPAATAQDEVTSEVVTLIGPSLSLALTGLLVQQIGVLATILCFEVSLVLLAIAATLNRALRAARPLADL